MADLSEGNVEVKPSIIMKVDAPPEDNNVLTSQGSSNNSETESTVVRPVLSTPKLNSNNRISQNNMTTKGHAGLVLRPSSLGAKLENKTKNIKSPFTLCPSRLNPFAQVEKNEEQPSVAAETTNLEKNGAEVEESNSTTTVTENSASSSLAPKFVPLVVTTETPKANTSNVTTTSIVSTPNFVFGQNLHERVISEAEGGESSTVDSNSISSASTSSSSSSSSSNSNCTNANGTSELLFSSAAKKTTTSQEQSKEVKSLSESAREYEESRANNKRKYEEVQVVTGEEDEKNVLQINCKLFAYDKATSNWQERGRGLLRLNDKEITENNVGTYCESRLVVRTVGNFKVVLNTKIWAEMTVDRASVKSLRLTAMDTSGQIKVFLVMANQDEINQLQRLLDTRVNTARQKQQQKISEPELKKQAIDNENSEQ